MNNFKKQTIFLLFLSLLLGAGNDLYAQRKKMKDKYDFSSNFFQVGYANIDTKKLQNFFPGTSIDPLYNDFIILGFSNYSSTKRVIGGGSFDVVFNRNKDNTVNATKSQLINLNLIVDIGYDLIPSKKVTFFPKVGLGANFSFLNITNNQSISASQIAVSPGNEVNLRNINFILDFGLGLDFNLGMKDLEDECEGKAKAWSLGLRAGYWYAVDSKNWRYSGSKVSDAPSFGPSGFYAKLVIGGTVFFK